MYFDSLFSRFQQKHLCVALPIRCNKASYDRGFKPTHSEQKPPFAACGVATSNNIAIAHTSNLHEFTQNTPSKSKNEAVELISSQYTRKITSKTLKNNTNYIYASACTVAKRCNKFVDLGMFASTWQCCDLLPGAAVSATPR